MNAFERYGRELAALRAELNDSKRARRADRCERATFSSWDDYEETHDAGGRYVPPVAASPVLPCWKTPVDLGHYDCVSEPMWKAAPEKMCAACQRNAVRAMRESGIRRRSGTLLRLLSCAHRRSARAPSAVSP